jgi:hypothetical protein
VEKYKCAVFFSGSLVEDRDFASVNYDFVLVKSSRWSFKKSDSAKKSISIKDFLYSILKSECERANR